MAGSSPNIGMLRGAPPNSPRSAASVAATAPETNDELFSKPIGVSKKKGRCEPWLDPRGA